MKARIVPDVGDLRGPNGQPGDIQIRRETGIVWGVAFLCPCGCGNESYLPNEVAGHGSGWTFSGPDDALTARPSVLQSGMPCKWHGWLTDGQWVQC